MVPKQKTVLDLHQSNEETKEMWLLPIVIDELGESRSYYLASTVDLRKDIDRTDRSLGTEYN